MPLLVPLVFFAAALLAVGHKGMHVLSERISQRILGAWLKVGVSDSRLKPEAVRAVEAAVSVSASGGYGRVIVTSTDDGKHGAGSLHPLGLAVDIRSVHLSQSRAIGFRDALRRALGPGYDVILEGPGGTKAGYDKEGAPHIHAEYDPKVSGGSYV